MFSRAEEKTRMEQAYEKAGFRVERNGKSTVFERELPEAVIEATRALINGHGKRASNAEAAKTNGGAKGAP